MVNERVYTLTANRTDHVKQAVKLEAVAGQATLYQVTAAFDGTNPQSRNVTVTDPYGRNRLVCTSNQWDFKSSQNMVTLTVEAPKTDVNVSEPAGSAF